MKQKFKQSKLKTIFIGGGTPNLFDPIIAKIFDSINTNFDIETIVRLQWKLIQAR